MELLEEDKKPEEDTNKPEPPKQELPPPTVPLDTSITIPPEDIRQVIDKLVEYIQKHGKEFEEKIRVKEFGNQKFEFMNNWSPYYAYYQHKLNPPPTPIISGSSTQGEKRSSTVLEEEEKKEETEEERKQREEAEKKAKRLKKAKLFGKFISQEQGHKT
jgi:hypothetical protein